jgi:hypothetical protein
MRAKNTRRTAPHQVGQHARAAAAATASGLDRAKDAVWAPSARQIKRALELIQPASRQRTMCKRDIVQALETVEFNRIMTEGSPAAHKRKFGQFAKKLRAIEVSDIRHYAKQSWMEELTSLRRWFEETADKIKLRHGSRRLKRSKQFAAIYAYALLLKYRTGPPGLTRDGTWHRLATILYGSEQADLFDYLRRFTKPSLYNDLRTSPTDDGAQPPSRGRKTERQPLTPLTDIRIGPLTAMIAAITRAGF